MSPDPGRVGPKVGSGHPMGQCGGHWGRSPQTQKPDHPDTVCTSTPHPTSLCSACSLNVWASWGCTEPPVRGHERDCAARAVPQLSDPLAAGMNMSPVSRLKKTWARVKTAKFFILEVKARLLGCRVGAVSRPPDTAAQMPASPSSTRWTQQGISATTERPYAGRPTAP